MRKIIAACDSFKGSLSSVQAAEAVAAGVRDVLPRCDVAVVPLGDGGEGTASAMAAALGLVDARCMAADPLMRPLEAVYHISRDGVTAVMDMASASGLTLVEPALRNPMCATSYGTGMMMADAIGRGCRRILVGLGGSATCDGGTGMLQALGYVLADDRGCVLPRGCGAMLPRVSRVDGRARLRALDGVEIVGMCDVSNPFCGPAGAARVFAPQKGASDADVELLESGMSRLARVYSEYCGTDMGDMPRAGAAGGLGGVLAAVLGAALRPGIECVLEVLGFDELLADADLVITGEGCLDAQTCMGKAPFGVLAASRRHGVPVVALGGRVEMCPQLAGAGFAAVKAVSNPADDTARSMRPEVAWHNVRCAVAEFLNSCQLVC